MCKSHYMQFLKLSELWRLTHKSNAELQWNPLKTSQLTKFSQLSSQNNLVPKYSHMINTYIALLISFPFKSISHLTAIKISLCKNILNYLIHSCIKIPSVKFVPNSSVLVLHHQTQSDSLRLFVVAYLTLSLAIYNSPLQFSYTLTGSLQPSVLVLYHTQSGSLYLPIHTLHQNQSAALHFSVPALCHAQFTSLHLTILVIFQTQSYIFTSFQYSPTPQSVGIDLENYSWIKTLPQI